MEMTPVQKNQNGDDDNSAVILKPGSNIKPSVGEDDVKKLAERLYGIIVSEICELNAYDDRNFLIQADCHVKNPILKKLNTNGYVMKIANSLDSQDIDFFSGQIEMMLHLNSKSIKCPMPVQNIFGKYYSTEKFGSSMHVVRLQEFIPGKVFHGMQHNDNIYYQAGKFVASIDNALKTFNHESFKTRKSMWMLSEVHQIQKFLYAVKDESRKDIIEQVLSEFDKKITPHLASYEKGIIHGDFNEHNIIVNRKANSLEYEVTGVIDFGDASCSYYVFELAIAMTYMMLEAGEIETGGLVMAGYSMIRNIPQREKEILKLCVAARLCQSLVMGLYTATIDTNNEYILSSQKKGWTLLEALWQEKDDDVLQLWTKVSEHYLTQSYK